MRTSFLPRFFTVALAITLAAPCLARVYTGAEQMEKYLPMLADKSVALVANHTSVVGSAHLLDTLLAQGVRVVRVFSPEHGFRGEAEAGATVNNDTDKLTGIEIVSLYGASKKPARKHLSGVQVVVFDMQDVGARFYTYLSTLHYVMEACAEQAISLVVLDRPNPNIALIDGPVLEPQHRSFVGLHPIPLAHGMTLGELAQMLNGEGWLHGGKRCRITVIPCSGYTRSTRYSLPIAPSPNLPNMRAVYLYPSLCLFEGTIISVARGTGFPFQAIGHPLWSSKGFVFTPHSIRGVSANPLYKDVRCYGIDLRRHDIAQVPAPQALTLGYLIEAYRFFSASGQPFFNSFFVKLAGTATLQSQIEQGLSEAQIRASWQPAIGQFKQQRKPYLLYE